MESKLVTLESKVYAMTEETARYRMREKILNLNLSGSSYRIDSIELDETNVLSYKSWLVKWSTYAHVAKD